MPESELDKVLRLAKGTTRTYNRVEQGRPQQVHQYQNNRYKGTPRPGQGGTKTKATDFAKLPTSQTTWGKLNDGDIVDFGGEPWQVLHAFVTSPTTTTTGKAGKPNAKGVRTPGTKTRTGANPGGPKKSAAKSKSSASSSAAKPFTGPEAHIMENLWSGKRVQVTLHANFKVWVY